MNNSSEQLEALKDIRRMMKESSRFSSLSGLSGVLAGFYALGGAAAGAGLIRRFEETHPNQDVSYRVLWQELSAPLVVLAGLVLVLSVGTAFFLSAQKARRNKRRLFDHSSRQLFWSMAVPLAAGGVFCLAMLKDGGPHVMLISPAMLIFYGLALVSSSRFTLNELKYLGYMELALGMLALFFRSHGLLFWALGFGLLHIVYGGVMWYRYDRRKSE